VTDNLWALLVGATTLGALGLIMAGGVYVYILRQPSGSGAMQEIATAIHEGAMVFLKREYQILSVFVLVVFALLGWCINGSTAMAFLAGAAFSMLAGYFGMEAATRANVAHGAGCQSTWRGAGAHVGLLWRCRDGAVGGELGIDRHWLFLYALCHG